MDQIKIAWIGKHFGEEPPLVGGEGQGAGGIFFSGCNLRCVFCQNVQISQGGLGRNYSVEELAREMIRLQSEGAVNIDLVTPTIWWRMIREAIILARARGLKLPIVWNSNAYESLEIINGVADVVDIFLPDFKYADDEMAEKYSGVKKYFGTAVRAIRRMIELNGELKINKNGLAERGVIVRHLVLPNAVENSFGVLETLVNISPKIHVALMNQYVPMARAMEFPEINRRVSDEEFVSVRVRMDLLGIRNGWVQGEGEAMVPDFEIERPFEVV